MKARREYARIIKSIYTVLLARKNILEGSQAIPEKLHLLMIKPMETQK
jgi:hypothetical protein